MLQHVTSIIFNALSYSGPGVLCSSSSRLLRFLDKIGAAIVKKCFCKLPKRLLQLLQFYFFINESKNSKGLQAVTRCRSPSQFVTTCYNSVTFCYKVCYRFVTALIKRKSVTYEGCNKYQ